ncbi:MAG: glycosyltransferase [Acidobacteriaceae bacterium]|nr:glycosyltransferase [Acidobacteriaceae bacterium]
MALPYHIFLHDSHFICPRVTLLDANGLYCGEPASNVCNTCMQADPRPIRSPVASEALRKEFAKFLLGADRIVAPSVDLAARFSAHFGLVDINVIPPNEALVPMRPHRPRLAAQSLVAVVGAVGEHKGYEILLACAEDAAERRLPLNFVLIGHSIDDGRLLATGHFFITGRYDEGEAPELLRREAADIGFIPSIWPETWCFALTELWRAGLHVFAFALGAQAERIGLTGNGTLLRLGTPAPVINDLLLKKLVALQHRKC